MTLFDVLRCKGRRHFLNSGNYDDVIIDRSEDKKLLVFFFSFLPCHSVIQNNPIHEKGGLPHRNRNGFPKLSISLFKFISDVDLYNGIFKKKIDLPITFPVVSFKQLDA